jgi:hypothetical protein
MHTRFITFVGELVSLEKKIINEEINGKIFRFLPVAWELEAAVMEEDKNLKMHDVDEFICSLIAHKGKLKELEAKDYRTKKKCLALKSMINHKEVNGSNSQEDNDDIKLIIKIIIEFLRKKMYGTKEILEEKMVINENQAKKMLSYVMNAINRVI